MGPNMGTAAPHGGLRPCIWCGRQLTSEWVTAVPAQAAEQAAVKRQHAAQLAAQITAAAEITKRQAEARRQEAAAARAASAEHAARIEASPPRLCVLCMLNSLAAATAPHAMMPSLHSGWDLRD